MEHNISSLVGWKAALVKLAQIFLLHIYREIETAIVPELAVL